MNKLGKKKKRWKAQRALGVELPGLGRPGAIARREYPPGQHGFRRRKISEYGLRLREKQKIMLHYCLREEQLRKFILTAKQGLSSDWATTVVQNLELRLDNLVFRLGFANSIPAARQLVRHGKVLVNGKKITIGSFIAKKNDLVTLAPKAFENASVMRARQNPRLPLGTYLSMDGNVGRVDSLPTFGDAPIPIERNLVIEYYSKLKA
jgi:small subunit ribosomal protein S4